MKIAILLVIVFCFAIGAEKGNGQADIEALIKLEMKRLAEESNSSLQILVVGESGTGKSTLINGLLGKQDAVVGHEYKSVTKDTIHHRKIGRLDITLFDTPGHLDNDKVMEDIEKETQGNIDVVLFCIKMTDVRLGFDQIEALRRVNSLGESIWEKGMFVMTFANHITETTIPRDEKLDEYFKDRVAKWKAHLTRTIKEEFGIPSEVAENIPVVPAGGEKRRLPDREHWISEMWIQVFRRLDCPKMMALFMNTTSEEKHYSTDLKFDLHTLVLVLVVMTLVTWKSVKFSFFIIAVIYAIGLAPALIGPELKEYLNVVIESSLRAMHYMYSASST